MLRIKYFFAIAGLVASCALTAGGDTKPMLRRSELIGRWLEWQTCCEYPDLIFHADGTFWQSCGDKAGSSGKWHMVGGHEIILIHEVYDPTKPSATDPNRHDHLIVLSVDRHSPRVSITLRYPNGSVQTWLKRPNQTMQPTASPRTASLSDD
jgi:hypothetical protein